MNLSELKSRYKDEKDPDVRERLLMMIWLKKGKTTYDIAELLSCPQSKVMYWKGKFEKQGIEGLKTIPKPGRAPMLSKEQVMHVRRKLEAADYWLARLVRELIYEETHQVYSERHVVRLLHIWGFEKIRPRKEHMLADEREQKRFSKKREIYWGLSRKAGQQSVRTNRYSSTTV